MLQRIKYNNKIKMLPIIIIYLFNISIVKANRCFTVNYNNIVPEYKLINKYSRSMETIIIEKNTQSLKQCKQLAITRKALAFNYYYHNSNNNNKKKLNCQLLECPEINSFNLLTPDNQFSYYSLYPRYLYPVNVTVKCLPRVGVFFTSEEIKKNYTEAQKICEQVNGKLAHVISEERTQGLAKFINNDTPVFVGLSNRRRSSSSSSSTKQPLWINEFDEPLNCFDYRGWNNGEPSGSRGCVGLILTKSLISDKTPVWRVLPCSQSFPFICEILPRIKITKTSG